MTRLEAFDSARQTLKAIDTEPPTELILALIHNCAFFISNVSDVSMLLNYKVQYVAGIACKNTMSALMGLQCFSCGLKDIP